jgi:hypothetical protein
MIRTSLAAFIAVSFVSVSATQSLADPRCQQLEALHAQYAGVELTVEQKVLKRKLVAWYQGHCGGRHVARED